MTVTVCYIRKPQQLSGNRKESIIIAIIFVKKHIMTKNPEQFSTQYFMLSLLADSIYISRETTQDLNDLNFKIISMNPPEQKIKICSITIEFMFPRMINIYKEKHTFLYNFLLFFS